MKELAFGIDFGTTNSLLSIWGTQVQEGRKLPEPMLQGAGRPHPSVVWYQLERPPIVGEQARTRMAEEQNLMGNAFYRSIKRKLGKNHTISVPGEEPIEAWRAGSETFKHLKTHAESEPVLQGLGSTIGEAVVSIPVHFDGRSRRDLRQAMREAGINLTTFVHEPFAALLAQFYDPETKLQSLRDKKVLVFDWGGGTLDVCLAAVSADGRQIIELGRSWINDLAGDEFDHRLMADIKNQFITSEQIDPDRFILEKAVEGRFWNRCENAKIALSNEEITDLIVPSFWSVAGNPIDLETELTRGNFEVLIEHFLDKAMAAVNRCLEEAGIDQATLVDEVVMVGGSSNIPAIRHRMIELFGSRVSVVNMPEAAISRGAAIVAAEGWRPFAARSVAIQLSDDTYFDILKFGQPLIGSESREFTFFCVDPRSGQADFFFHERPDEGDPIYQKLSDMLSIPVTRHLAGLDQLKRDRIVCRFSVSEDLTLQCRGRSSSLGQDKEVEVHDICFGLHLD